MCDSFNRRNIAASCSRQDSSKNSRPIPQQHKIGSDRAQLRVKSVQRVLRLDLQSGLACRCILVKNLESDMPSGYVHARSLQSDLNHRLTLQCEDAVCLV